MNHWSAEHRLRRHAAQRRFEALERHDGPSVRRWATEVDGAGVLQSAFGAPRDGFWRALVRSGSAEESLGVDAWIEGQVASMAHALADRSTAGDPPAFALDWWIDRPRVWVEQRVRRQAGRAVLRAIERGYLDVGARGPDGLEVDAAFAQVACTLLDAAASFDPARDVTPWIVGVAHHVARDLGRVDRARAHAPAEGAAMPDAAARDDDSVEWADTRSWLLAAAAGPRPTPEDHMVVQQLIDADGSVGTLARALGWRPERLYKRRVELRARLREAVRLLYEDR